MRETVAAVVLPVATTLWWPMVVGAATGWTAVREWHHGYGRQRGDAALMTVFTGSALSALPILLLYFGADASLTAVPASWVPVWLLSGAVAATAATVLLRRATGLRRQDREGL